MFKCSRDRTHTKAEINTVKVTKEGPRISKTCLVILAGAGPEATKQDLNDSYIPLVASKRSKKRSQKCVRTVILAVYKVAAQECFA